VSSSTLGLSKDLDASGDLEITVQAPLRAGLQAEYGVVRGTWNHLGGNIHH
jgi:hypothetical protein